MPGAMTPCGVLPARGDRVEGGRRAEVDDDGGPPVELDRRHRVDDAVGADLLGVVHEDRDAGLDAGFHEDGGHVSVVAPGDLAQLVQDRGDGGADRDAVDAVAEFVAEQRVHAHQALEEHGQFVGGAAGVGGDAPVLDDLLPVEQAEDGVRVAYVDGEQHGDYSAARRSRPMSRIGDEWVSAPTARKSTPVAAYSRAFARVEVGPRTPGGRGRPRSRRPPGSGRA